MEDIMKGTGLVLSGGGAKGGYQAGVMVKLHELGRLDDLVGISGDSIGAVNAAIYMQGPEKLPEIWKEMKNSKILKVDVNALSQSDHLLKRDEIDKLLDQFVDEELFDIIQTLMSQYNIFQVHLIYLFLYPLVRTSTVL